MQFNVGLRKCRCIVIGRMPYNCHTTILERLSGTITIFDTLCKRSTNFVQKCLHYENVLVNFVLFLVMLFSIVECYLVWDEMCSFTVNVLVQVYMMLLL